MKESDLITQFTENLPGAALRYSTCEDGTSRITFLNEGCRKIFGIPRNAPDPTPEQLWDMIDPADLDKTRSVLEMSAQQMTLWELRFGIRDWTGRHKHCLGRGTPTRLPDGRIEWLTFIFDITAQARTEAQVKSVSYQLRLVSEAIPDGFALFDRDERLVISNRHFRQIYDLPPDDAAATGWLYVDLLHHATAQRLFPDARGREEAWIEERLMSFRRADAVVEERHGAARWFRILDRPTQEGGRVAFRIETTSTRNREADLERAALTDSLTGLWNRRGLWRHLKHSVEALDKMERIALLHMDLDKFKTVNDGAGHEAGDAVLIAVANRVSALLDDRASVARIGGDEFVFALPTAESDEDVLRRAEALRLGLTQPVPFEGRLLQVGASIGVAFWIPAMGADLDQSLLDADTALLKGKVYGRNRTICFREEMRGEAQRLARVAGEIKRDLSRGCFVPFFQPQVSLPDGKVVGLETLARWIGSDGKIIPACDFVPIAQDTGLIGEIDRQMTLGALDLLGGLMSEGRLDLRTSINLSSTELRDPDAPDRLLDQLFARGIPARFLTVEILESTLLDDRSDVIATNIAALDRAGCLIELDDFGTGHTALASLQRFPVHKIKIDRSLIHNIHEDSAKLAIVRGIVALCRSLEVGVIAEGVESQAEISVLTDLGIELFQGYAIAKPMPARKLRQWLAEQAASREIPRLARDRR